LREQIRSPYYWLAVLLTLGGAILVWRSAKLEWMQALGLVLYIFALIASAVARRDARAAGIGRGTTDEKATK
jgi:protein-S-isoprenylcysteine O-methyltransferase Ste14